MSIQLAVRTLESLGPLPSEDDASEQILEQWEAALNAIQTPINDEEAVILCGLFGPDDGYGLAWTLLHTVETAPSWFIEEAVTRAPTEWSDRLRRRYQNFLDHKKSDSEPR